MAAASTCATVRLDDGAQKAKGAKRLVHHHHQHIRPPTKPADRQRKVKRRPINFISTDGTTSGDEGEDVQLSACEVDLQTRLEQLIKRPDQSDLDADCEDNNSTDIDAVSTSSSSLRHRTGAGADDLGAAGADTRLEILNAKIRNLEKQLSVVLSVNLKLKEENDRLKSGPTKSETSEK